MLSSFEPALRGGPGDRDHNPWPDRLPWRLRRRYIATMASASRPEDRPAPVAFSAPWFDEAEARRITEALAGRVGGDGPFGRRVGGGGGGRLGGPRGPLPPSCTHHPE